MVICLLLLRSQVIGQQIYMKLTDVNGAAINGSSITQGYLQQVEASAVGQESSACPNTFTSASCTPVTGNFVVNIYPDQSITDFRKALYLRRKWQKVEISFIAPLQNGGNYTFQKITLTDVYVTKITDGVSSGGGLPTVQVNFDPTTIVWTWTTYNGQTVGTPRSFTWDRSNNTGF